MLTEMDVMWRKVTASLDAIKDAAEDRKRVEYSIQLEAKVLAIIHAKDPMFDKLRAIIAEHDAKVAVEMEISKQATKALTEYNNLRSSTAAAVEVSDGH